VNFYSVLGSHLHAPKRHLKPPSRPTRGDAGVQLQIVLASQLFRRGTFSIDLVVAPHQCSKFVKTLCLDMFSFSCFAKLRCRWTSPCWQLTLLTSTEQIRAPMFFAHFTASSDDGRGRRCWLALLQSDWVSSNEPLEKCSDQRLPFHVLASVKVCWLRICCVATPVLMRFMGVTFSQSRSVWEIYGLYWRAVRSKRYGQRNFVINLNYWWTCSWDETAWPLFAVRSFTLLAVQRLNILLRMCDSV